ncbi:hypothetical protein MACH21_33250 [Roseicyclus marinus]|uniref:Uncharacterized protein n=1 Tax=Roseicyclus marinus TaxID=2161673 RepID=A0AA48KLQ7_9RHOB|nr:hypothetical protein MACH21_33250 [Roseicyclus marinus]
MWLSRETLLKQYARHPDIPLSEYEDLSWAFASDLIYGDKRAGRFHIVTAVTRDPGKPDPFQDDAQERAQLRTPVLDQRA